MKNRKRINGRTRMVRFLLMLLILVTACSILGDAAAWLIRIRGGISFAVSSPATIGIIGGADGPTAIFVTSATAPLWQTLVKGILLILGILGIRQLKIPKGEE